MRGRHVRLARRNLLADRRRLLAGVLGVGLALMLTLLLGGLWDGVQAQAQLYPKRVGADLFVTQRGVRNFLGESSTIPIGAVDIARATPGVQWAAPVRGEFAIFELHAKKVAAYVVGSVPGEAGGPWSLSEGRVARTNDEAVVDDSLARRHDLGVGDRVEIGGRRFRVVGLASDALAPMTGFVFVTHAATDELQRSPDTTSYVLIGTDHPRSVKRRLEAQGLNVLTRDELAESDRALYTSILGSPIKLMVAVAFVAGTLVIALTIYASVVERRREYGIVKALGASGARIAAIVVHQTLLLVAIGLIVGGVLFLGSRLLITTVRPQFSIVLTAGGLARALIAALVMGLVAALVPARRVATAEPASVYRGG
jgi:putative ABC transport system permease protein